jgi:hypothetical protein
MSGWRIAVLVLGVAVLAAGLGLGLPKLLSGDHDKYGRVAIPPGRGTVELPAGEVIVFYEEARAISAKEVFPEPQIDWSIRPAGGGAALPLDGDGGRETNVGVDRAWTDFEGLDVPESGPYRVVVRKLETRGASPAITFGTSGVTASALALVIGGALIGVTLITLALVIRRG